MRARRASAAGAACVLGVALLAARAHAADFTISGLKAAEPVTNAAPRLEWQPLSGAVAYRVVRDRVFLARITATEFTDSGLTAEGTHTYRIRAVRSDGTVSTAASVPVVYDTEAPGAITSAPTGHTPTGGTPDISWTAAADAGPAGVAQYNVRRNGVYIASVPAGTLSFSDANAPEGPNTYVVRAEDAAGNKAATFSPELTITVDRTAPDAPAGLAATVTGASVQLTWKAAGDPSGISGYRVLRDGQGIATVSGTSAQDPAPTTGDHSYTVIAIDGAGNPSAASTPVVVSVEPISSGGATAGRLALQANLQMWGPGVPDAATAVALARTHDMITALPGQIGPYLAQMRQANPNLKLYAYVNGMFAGKNQGDLFPATWYMRDANGNKLTSAGWGNYLMDPRATTPFTYGGRTYSGWTDWVRKHCLDDIQTAGFDSCFLDMLVPAPVYYHPYLLHDAVPIENATTDQPWSTSDYMQLTGGVGEAVQAYVGRGVIGNSLEWGAHFYSIPTRALLPFTRMSLAELWMRTPNQAATSWPSVDRWKQEVQMVMDANATGDGIEVTLKLWSDSTAAEKQAWRAFGQASFLIGNSGAAWFEYSSSQSTYAWNDTSPLDGVDLGAPLDTHGTVDGYLRGGVYQRRFERGIALVNPGTSPVTVTLDRTYRTPAGTAVSTVTLGAHAGVVLLTP